MDNNIINECSSRSLAGTITFPEVVMKLASHGVERYIADLVGRHKNYFGNQDEIHSTVITLENPQKVSVAFDSEEVKRAITEIQQNRINYQTFLGIIMKAGCTHYEVFINGKKAIYFGRDGSFHIEEFPKGK